jgi:hypothetical protein
MKLDLLMQSGAIRAMRASPTRFARTGAENYKAEHFASEHAHIYDGACGAEDGREESFGDQPQTQIHFGREKRSESVKG